MAASTLASELTERTLWNPTVLGVLVTVCAVVLFCGSIYLLLGTNLGARLGFLVAFTGLAGFMVILTALWITTSSPLNTLKGRIPAWEVQQVITGDLDRARIEAVRDIERPGNRVDTTEAANIKAAVDEAIVEKVGTPTVEIHPEDNRFAQFADVTEYQILETYEIGGSDPQFWKGQFTHDPQFAAVQFCEVLDTSDRTFGLPPLPPECNPEGTQGWVILQRDLGSLRVPAFVAFFMSAILFILGLLALHWREKDEMEVEAQKAAAPTPVRVPEKV